MPKAAVLQGSFSSGEVSPLYYGQAQNPRYKKGLLKSQNLLPLLQGPVVRRPGTKFCAKAKVTGGAPILIPFIFSQTQAYMLEFGDQYIRFYTNNAQMLTNGSSFQITGINSIASGYSDPNRLSVVGTTIGNFYATRALNQLQANEFSITTATPVISGNILELPTPYLQNDLSQIRWVQNADTIYLFHPNYPIYKLQRQGQTYWELYPVVMQDGPYLPLNSYKTIGDMSNFSLQLVTYVPKSSPIGSARLATVSTTITNATNDGSGQIAITTATAHGLSTGQNVFISSVGGTTEANNYDAISNPGGSTAFWQIQVVNATKFILLGSSFVHAYTAGGASYPALFAQGAAALKANLQAGSPVALPPDAGRLIAFVIGGKRYYGYLTPGDTSCNAALWTAIWPDAQSLPSTITAWQLGVYSPGFGFPRCGAFHQDRLVLGGAGGAPQEIDGSATGNYENFAPSDPTTLNVVDSNAYSFQLNSSETNFIQWLSSTAQGLLCGTYVSEWVITPSSTADALTPTNFNAQQSSYFGSAATGAVQIGNGTFYIQRAQRKVREMAFFFTAGTFRSADLTELSEHITIPQIYQLSVTKETQPIIWARRGDGALTSLVYSRDDASLIAGWSSHLLGGQSDSAGNIPLVLSIAAIPSADVLNSFDQLWLLVQRYINGQTMYLIEYMTKIFDDSILQEDAFELDCGYTFFNPAAISAITSANPAHLTATGVSSLFLPLANGDRVRIFSVNGMSKTTTDVNGNSTTQNLVNYQDFIVANVNNVTLGGITTSDFDLHDFSGNPIDSTSFGPYIVGGFVAKIVTTISGLTWLENETVSLLIDGGITSDVVVSNTGSITLPVPGMKVQIGYSFKSRGQLLRIDAGAPDGTAIGKTRRTSRVAVQMHRTGDLKLGTSFDNMIPVELSQADVDDADQPMPLFSGMIREGVESAYDFESQVCFEMSSALPACIQSVTSFMDEFDV